MRHRFLPPSYFNPPRLSTALVAGLMRAQRRVPSNARPPEWAEPRGVYWSPHLERGKPYLYAIDSRGEVVKRLRLKRSESAEDAIAYLWRYLNTVDAPDVGPKLALVRAS